MQPTRNENVTMLVSVHATKSTANASRSSTSPVAERGEEAERELDRVEAERDAARDQSDDAPPR